jgi:Fe-S-cluster containining protein
MSNDEVQKIKAYMRKHTIKEQRHNYLTGIDLTCPFRDEANRKCLIYSVRPWICRQFMCNHTQKDIERAKIEAHTKYRPVLMRAEFFGNKEDEIFYAGVLKRYAAEWRL